MDSDWDITIVLEGSDPNRPSPARSIFPQSELPADLPRVDVWALSEDDLHRRSRARRSRALGTLPYVVCRDGRVLAGEWNRPDPAQVEHEATMNPEDWARRMDLVLTKLDTAITQIEKIAASRTWTGCAANCIMLLQDSADAAGLLVKAAMERRGVPADRSHDVAELAAAFSAQRPGESALAQRMADPNITTRSHHIALYEFQPPEPSNTRVAVKRVADAIGLWASEIETTCDAMTAQLAGLARSAVDRAEPWPRLVAASPVPKTDNHRQSRASAEAALALRPDPTKAIALFRDRMRQVMDGAIFTGRADE